MCEAGNPGLGKKNENGLVIERKPTANFER
jgi:hypothetical protein